MRKVEVLSSEDEEEEEKVNIKTERKNVFKHSTLTFHLYDYSSASDTALSFKLLDLLDYIFRVNSDDQIYFVTAPCLQ